MPLNVIQAPTDISNTGLVSFTDPPQLATLSNGGYALTYVYSTDVIVTNDVVTKVFDAQGQPVASNVVSQQAVVNPQIAALSVGGFALAWEQDIISRQIYTAVFDAQGQQLSLPVDVNNNPNPELLLAVEPSSNGGYVVTWQSQTTPGNYDILLATYDANGQEVVAPINVSNTPSIDDETPYLEATILAVLSNGNYALTWESVTPGGGADIFTAVYDANGQQVAAPVDVTNSINATDNDVEIAALSTGGYVLTWTMVPRTTSSPQYTVPTASRWRRPS